MVSGIVGEVIGREGQWHCFVDLGVVAVGGQGRGMPQVVWAVFGRVEERADCGLPYRHPNVVNEGVEEAEIEAV